MNKLWRFLSLAITSITLTVLSVGCGGGGGQVSLSGQNQSLAAGTGAVALRLPARAGQERGAAKVPGTATSIYIQIYQMSDTSSSSSQSETSLVNLTKSVTLTSVPQDIVFSSLPPSPYAAYLYARDANNQTVAARTTYLYVTAGKTVDVLAELGYTENFGSIQPGSANAITYSSGDLIALDHGGTDYTVTTLSSGQSCAMTLGYKGYLACPAGGASYAITLGSTTAVSGNVQSTTASQPIGIGVFRGGLRPGQTAEAIVFSTLGSGTGVTHTLSWGDGATDTVVPGQRVAHTYSSYGYYRLTATGSYTSSLVGRDASSTSSYTAQAGVTVFASDYQGADLYIRSGNSVNVSATALSAVSGSTGDIAVSDNGAALLISVTGAATGEGLATVTSTTGAPQASACSSVSYQSSLSVTSNISFGSTYYCYKKGSVGPVILKQVSTYVAANKANDSIPGEVGLKLMGSNTPPVITSATSASGTVGQAFSYTATATDANGDTVTFSFSGLPTWASASGATVTGTPTSAGSFSFGIIASDGSSNTTGSVSGTIAAATSTGGTGAFTNISTIAGTRGVSGSATTPSPTFRLLGDVESLPNGNLLVHDSENNRLVEITTTGSFVNARTATNAEDFAVDSAGNYFYLAYGSGFQPPFTIHKIDTAGTDTIFMNPPSTETFSGLTIDSSGNLYTLSQPSPFVQSASTTVHKITPQGVGSVFNTINNSTVNNCPIEVEASVDGSVYVLCHCSNSIIKFNSAGNLVANFTNASFDSIRPLGLDAQGNIYVGSYTSSTTFGGFKLTPTGTVTTLFNITQATFQQLSVDGGPGTATVHAANGFTVASDGSIYFTDGFDFIVRKMVF